MDLQRPPPPISTMGSAMIESLGPIAVAAIYLIALTGVARWADGRASLRSLARHPITLGLAMGCYATAWTLYGSVGFADANGYDALAISMGVALSCLAIPALWAPLGQVVRRHRLGSVADLLALRFDSQSVGSSAALLLVAGLLPYIALQMRAVTDAGHLLSLAWGADHTGPAGGGPLCPHLNRLYPHLGRSLCRPPFRKARAITHPRPRIGGEGPGIHRGGPGGLLWGF